MKKIIVVIIAISLISIGILGWYWNSVSPKLEIQATANIPYHEGGGLEIGVGSAGTLYCLGAITKTDQGMGNIRISWIADVEFPSNYVSGSLCNGAVTEPVWARCLQPISEPGYTNVVWRDADGENHLWKMIETFRADSLRIDWYIDDVLIDSMTFNDAGYLAILGGFDENTPRYHRVHATFNSKKIPTNPLYDLDIETSEFYLVRKGNDFYFVDDIPIGANGGGSG